MEPIPRPRLSVPVFLGMLAAGLAAAALVVAFLINAIELAPYFSAVPLPWDPTHTARKYLLLAGAALAGAYLWHRYGRGGGGIAPLPALLLALAVPVGAAGYESVSGYWGWAAWIESDPEKLHDLRRDPYVYLGDRSAETTMAVRIREDTLQLGRLMTRVAGGDPDGLQAAEERKVRKRRRTGWSLLALSAALLVGAAWLIRRERARAPAPS